MKVELINQKLGRDPLCDRLNMIAKQADIKNVTFVVAYMTLGGLDRLRNVLADLAAKTRTEIIVGIDHRLTTLEALQDALSIPRLTVRIFNINNPWIVFHPKVYVFERKQSLTLVVGSSNFTDGGLFSNFEVCLLVDLDCTDREDAIIAKMINSMLEEYRTPKPPLSANNARIISLNWLRKYKYLVGTETERSRSRVKIFSKHERSPFPIISIPRRFKAIRKGITTFGAGIRRLVVRVTDWDTRYTLVIPRGSEVFFGIKFAPNMPYSDEFKVLATDVNRLEHLHVFSARQSGNFRISTPAIRRMNPGDLYVLDVDPRPDREFRSGRIQPSSRYYKSFLSKCKQSTGGKLFAMF